MKRKVQLILMAMLLPFLNGRTQAQSDSVECLFDTLLQKQLAFGVMSNLCKLWQDLDLEGKRMFLSSIFPKKLIFEKNQCRTTDGSSAIADLLLITNDLQSDETKKAANFDDLFIFVARTGIEPVLPE